MENDLIENLRPSKSIVLPLTRLFPTSSVDSAQTIQRLDFAKKMLCLHFEYLVQ